jgi:hypothetical protein
MNPNSMVLLLLVILGGVPIIILLYYGAQLALRFPDRPAPPHFPEGGRTTAARMASSPDASAPHRVGVVDSQPAVIRVLLLQEGGLPYASRSRQMRIDEGP